MKTKKKKKREGIESDLHKGKKRKEKPRKNRREKKGENFLPKKIEICIKKNVNAAKPQQESAHKTWFMRSRNASEAEVYASWQKHYLHTLQIIFC